ILVNSKFTLDVFKKTFTRIKKEPFILYPSIDIQSYPSHEECKIFKNRKVILSINRFERKKNISLAIGSFSMIDEKLLNDKNPLLVIAGGYDERLCENVEYFSALYDKCSKHGLHPFQRINKLEDIAPSNRVLLIPSFSKECRDLLLQNATVLIYTPENEHFGIVPIEAMCSEIPVIAINSGGPKESIVDGITGFLAHQNEKAIAEKINLLLSNEKLQREMGRKGRERVNNLFSLKSFAKMLESFIEGLNNHNKVKNK
ncbi:asparagine-linked glycosylation 2, alpha-1,3-mannosyltransferase-like protein, partial [Rozella allomycis CSF55]